VAKVEVEFSLTASQQQRLQKLFGSDFVEQHLPGIASAAVAEYIAMLSGDEVPRRLQDMQQSRLRWLIEKYKKGHFPPEHSVASWFKLTDNQARTLLSQMKARFEFEAAQWTVDAIKAALVDAKNDSSEWKDGYAPPIVRLSIPKVLISDLKAKAAQLDSSKQLKTDGNLVTVDRDLLAALIREYGAAVPAAWKKFRPFIQEGK
jgi:hypothetical protein